MKVSIRKGLPTKKSLYEIADSLKVSINSLDNRSSMDRVSWQHHNVDAMQAFMKILTEAGFEVYGYEPYNPKMLRAGSFRIKPQTK